jgi:hypothetical protein
MLFGILSTLCFFFLIIVNLKYLYDLRKGKELKAQAQSLSETMIFTRSHTYWPKEIIPVGGTVHIELESINISDPKVGTSISFGKPEKPGKLGVRHMLGSNLSYSMRFQ